MQDVTDRIMRLREMARHVWNTYFLTLGRDPKWDDVDDFLDIMRIAFHAAFELERNANPDVFRSISTPKVIDWLQVSPSRHDSVLHVLTNRESGPPSGYWDHDVREIAFPGSELHFVQLFDFEILGVPNFSYVMVFISRCESRPEAEGRYALLSLNDNPIVVLSTLDEPQ